MKIIRLHALSPDSDTDIHPDSAMILPGRPLFMPDMAGGWFAELYLAVRLSRLGKNIAPKFAPRYYDGISTAVRVTLSPDDMAAAGILPGLLSGMDSSVVHGEWQPAEELQSALTVTLAAPLTWSSPENTVTFPTMNGEVDAAIARVSAYMTLKMGDILLLPLAAEGSDSPLRIPLCEHIHITLSLNSTQTLDLKVV